MPCSPVLVLLRAPAPTGPQLLCAIGFGAGVAIFFYGLRLRRALSTIPNSDSNATNSDHIALAAHPAPAVPSVQIIRLSPDAAPMKSSEMTQQQKIAAALARAGIPNLAARTETQPERPDLIAVEVALDPSEPATPTAIAIDSTTATRPTNAESAIFKYTLMLWAGPLLSLICLYIFLSIR